MAVARFYCITCCWCRVASGEARKDVASCHCLSAATHAAGASATPAAATATTTAAKVLAYGNSCSSSIIDRLFSELDIVVGVWLSCTHQNLPS